MFGRNQESSLIRDMAIGAVAGLAGTFAIEKAFGLMQKFTGESVEGEGQEPGTHVLAERLHHVVGAEPTAERKARLGQVIHWSYGASWGALYGALRNRVPALSWGMGVPFGLLFGVLSDEILVTLAGLAPPPREIPTKQHVQMIAGHVVYAAAADAAYGVLNKALAPEPSRWERARARLGR